MTSRALLDKVLAAEQHVAWIRIAVVAAGTVWLFAGGGPASERSLELYVLVVAWIYTGSVAMFRPYRRFPLLRTAYFTTVTDAVISTMWIGVTGGFASPWHLLYYLGVAAIAVRFRNREVLGAAAIYVASYLGLLAVLGQVAGHGPEIFVRTSFIFLIAALCGPLASETVEQARQRRAVEEAAHVSEAAAAKLRALLETSKTPIVMFDAEGRIGYLNAPAGGIFDLDPEASVGEPPDALLSRIDVPEPTRAALATAFEEGSAELEFTVTRGKDRRELRAQISAYHDSTGAVLGLIAVCWDETARAQRERDLRTLRIKLEEAERRRIARELHDQVGQILTGLALSLDSTAKRGVAGAETLESARGLVKDLMARVRALSLDLRPAVLDDLGLMPALLALFERFSRQTGIDIEFKQSGLEQRRFGSDVETAAFRVVQEALTNVARHARTRKATVRAWTDDQLLSVQVEDQGSGFDPRAISSATSSGVAGMRERAALLGGQLSIESAPGQGTRLTAELPLARAAEGLNEGHA